MGKKKSKWRKQVGGAVPPPRPRKTPLWVWAIVGVVVIGWAIIMVSWLL